MGVALNVCVKENVPWLPHQGTHSMTMRGQSSFPPLTGIKLPITGNEGVPVTAAPLKPIAKELIGREWPFIDAAGVVN